ncbi:PAN2-PAN3 deadenylation complex subunit PAN3 isoform X1 [Lampetra planeri]
MSGGGGGGGAAAAKPPPPTPQQQQQQQQQPQQAQQLLLPAKPCRYYAKDRTCFYGDDCQFVHDDPDAVKPAEAAVAGAAAGAVVAATAAATAAAPMEGGGHFLQIPLLEGGGVPDGNLPNSFFSSSFIGVNGFGGGGTGDAKFPVMARMTNSSSSPSLTGDSAKLYSPSGQDSINSPNSSLFSDFSNLNLSAQRRKTPNPTASEFIPKAGLGASPRMSSGVAQSPIAGPFSPAITLTHAMTSPSSLAPERRLRDLSTSHCSADPAKAGSSPLHSPKVTPHTSPAARRRSHTPNQVGFSIGGGGGGGPHHHHGHANPHALTHAHQHHVHQHAALPQGHAAHPGHAAHVGHAAHAAHPGQAAAQAAAHAAHVQGHGSHAPHGHAGAAAPVPSTQSSAVADPLAQAARVQNETVGGTTYFFTEPGLSQHPGMVFPSYHVYPSPSAQVAYMQPKANAPSFFMMDELRQDLINRHLLTMAQIDQAENPDIPAEVDNYHSLFPLEPPQTNPMQKSGTFGYTTTCYKAVSSKDGMAYCLRRIHGYRLTNTKCMILIDMWKKQQHSNIVALREVFTTKAFGEHSLVFAHDFHAGAETLMSKHFSDPNADAFFNKRKWGQVNGPLPRQHAGLLPESLIWAYVVQLSSALRTVHSAGLACRVMHPSKILVGGKTRLRVNCVGIFDVLTFDGTQASPLALIPQYQQEDLTTLGKIVLSLSCNSMVGVQRDNISKAMELVTHNYSTDLKNLIIYLLSNQTRLRSVNDIMPMIGARFYTQLDAAQMRSDIIEEELAKEVQNGRLFRLLCKLGTINERPEFQKDTTWSETGDRYLLKLFRDHLFHQVSEMGAPWVDIAHIVQCVNKLDAGTPEKLSLVSRDEKSVLVVTYADLKRCFDNAFSELLAASNGQL